MEADIIKIFLAFVVLINPFAALSLFLDITQQGTRNEQRKVAFISASTVFITICFFSIAGEALLNLLGISLGSFRVAGGLLVLLIAIGMMNGDGNVAKPSVTTHNDLDGVAFNGVASAVVPLTIPMVIGPGGISTVIIYAATMKSYIGILAIIVAGFIISVMTYLSFTAAGRLSKLLGDIGLNVLNRIMGMLLAAVAIEIIVSGLRGLFPNLIS